MFYIKKYADCFKEQWDRFILTESINGTFLQSRQFIEYHPKERFKEASFFVENEKGNIVLAVSACDILDNEQKILYSHKGSTFGGIVISEKYYKADKLIELLDLIESYLHENKYAGVFLKQTSKIFARHDTELLEYLLVKRGYKEIIELSSYIDYETYREDVKSNFAQGKRTHVNNAERNGWEIEETHDEENIYQFYIILCDSLRKYNTKPVHTFAELLQLKGLLKNEIRFFVLKEKEKVIAGAMVFQFENTKSVHLQYSCADKQYEKQSAMTYLYFCLISRFMKERKKYFSFGISTEEMGKKLNLTLLKSKEQYGSKNCVNRSFFKHYKETGEDEC